MSNTLLPDDRRHLGIRLTALQYIVAVFFALPAPRGVLFDRNGQLLVENQNTFNIALVREQTKNLDETLRILAAATGVDEAQLHDTVNRRRREPSYRPIVL